MIVFNFNVIAKSGPILGSRLPDGDGLMLWRSLHETQMGRLGLVVDGESDTATLEAWLKINQVKAIMYETLPSSDPVIKAEKIALILGAAGGRGMYFDTDPNSVAETLKLGIASVLVCPPYVVRPEWSTQKVMRDWESLTEEIDRQVLLKSEKKWGDYE